MKLQFPKLRLGKLSGKTAIKLITAILCLVLFSPFILHLSVSAKYTSKKFNDIQKTPENYAALVLGAGIYANKLPSPILKERLYAAAELYKNGKVKKLILSGDNSANDYNEPKVMQDAILLLGVPQEALVLDYAGRRTYDSCYRARYIFSQNKITIVTQSFHMTRSLYLCRHLGIDAVGFIADKFTYNKASWGYWSFRDQIALSQSLIDLYISQPPVIKGQKIKI